MITISTWSRYSKLNIINQLKTLEWNEHISHCNKIRNKLSIVYRVPIKVGTSKLCSIKGINWEKPQSVTKKHLKIVVVNTKLFHKKRKAILNKIKGDNKIQRAPFCGGLE